MAVGLYTPNILTIVIMLVFLLKYDHVRKKDTKEATTIYAMALICIAGAFLSLFDNIMASYLGENTPDAVSVSLFFAILDTIEGVLVIQILIGWVVFVDFSLHRSSDRVERLYGYRVVPVVLIAVTVFLLNLERHLKLSGPLAVVILVGLLILFFGIQLYYVAKAYLLVRKSHQFRRQPTLLRLDIFMVPFLIGMIFSLQPVKWLGDLRFFTFAVGIVLTWRTVERRYAFMNPVTGFYNRDFLVRMNEFMEKNGYPNGSGVYFRAAGHGNELLSVLKTLRPDNSEVFVMGDDEYLLMSDVKNKSAIRLLIRSVEAAAADAASAIKVESGYVIREEGEDVSAFTKRILKLQKEGRL